MSDKQKEYSEERSQRGERSEERREGGNFSRQGSTFLTDKLRKWGLGNRINVLNSWRRRNKTRQEVDDPGQKRKAEKDTKKRRTMDRR